VTASPTLAIFHIEAMDCPVEEKLIRDRLSAMEGVKELTFDLEQRVLLVGHSLECTCPLVDALESLEMPPVAMDTYIPDACAAETVTASPTLAIFHIEAMDCPVEEKLIRDRLSAMEGVKELTFDLEQRVLLVEHSLECTCPLVDALKSLEMPPEAVESYTPGCGCVCACHEEEAPELDYSSLGEASDTRAIYRIMNMDCPVEEALIRKKLATVPGITHLEFNLMQRVLTVEHTLPSTRPIEDALNAIDMAPEAICRNTTTVFSVAGMCYPEEEKLIRAKLKDVRGIAGLEFNLLQRTLTVTHDLSILPAISSALASLNMGARLLADKSAGSAVPEPKIPWKRLALATLLAGLAEAAELAHEWGAKPFGLDMASWSVAGFPFLEVLPLICAVLAIALSGVATYKKGWLSIRNMALNMNALMSVAVTGAVIIGQYPEAAMVMVLFNISEAIEAKALDRARNAIKELLALAPQTATVLRGDGSWQEVDVREVAVGSRVRVRPGEKIALDGIVLSGHSTVNQAPITGESMPVEKEAGAQVYAGTINESGSFEFEVQSEARDSTLARIISAVEEAQGSRAPI
ncbi:MAG: heavy metal translocating P-type ATPase, partial [Desulfovibrionaceae bacterium]|nr:heavy metal translocating P-type ATPase [Desulfovibrionaceae bacterium]